MKLFFTCLIAILLSTAVYSQELASKGGLTGSYEASKTETTKKSDKYSVKITINNMTGADLYFSAALSPNAISFDAPYAMIVLGQEGTLSLLSKKMSMLWQAPN